MCRTADSGGETVEDVADEHERLSIVELSTTPADSMSQERDVALQPATEREPVNA